MAKALMARLLEIARIFERWEKHGFQISMHMAINCDSRECYRAYFDQRDDSVAPYSPLRNVGAVGVTWTDAVEALDVKGRALLKADGG